MDGLNILTLSGWTQPADALLKLAPQADFVDYADATHPQEVAEKLTKRDYDLVIGWSLGGIIARHLLSEKVLETTALITISSPYQFVRNEQVHAAMPADTFEQFYTNYRDDTQRTVKRFHGLVLKGDKRMKELTGTLGHHDRVHEVGSWLPWMDVLKGYSAKQKNYENLPPTLIVHGTEDAIVPREQAELLKDHLPSAEMLILEGCGHAPHLHAPDEVRAAIQNFHRKVAS